MSFLSKIFGDDNQRYLRSLEPLVEQINQFEKDISRLSSEELRAKTDEFREGLVGGETLDVLLPEVFAVVRETARRTLGERHYDVQLSGGIILHQGKIAEMKTGEGKTLVCTLPAYLNALAGRGVHVVTVNDYLARRDVVWMGQIYAALGLSVGVINHEASYLYDPSHTETDERRDTEGSFRVFYEFLKPCTRRQAYLADITYGTNNEFGFDYLRDHLAYEPEQAVQITGSDRPRHHFAVVDEVDSILIDEARTPLIIAAPVAESDELYRQFARIAGSLTPDEDYDVDEKTKTAALKDSGITKAERQLGVDNMYTDRGIKYVHHLETAVRARALFLCDRDYVVKNGEIIIVDEFTGRLQPGRRWSEGLHQAIEAKEDVPVRQESRTFASVTFQNYFKLYGKLAGMTGTALTSAEEFRRVYGLDVVAVPTNRPNRRQDLNDLIFQTESGKFRAVTRKIKELHVRGQPVLVGTISIEKNELLSRYLEKEGIPHRVLNAKNHEEEGAIIAGAGKKGSVVIATNMAGRGVDIKLGGAGASRGEYEEVKALGGLFILGTERHEARRIDNQLRGRSGRQGDPGTTQFFISLEDDLARIFAAETVKKLMGRFGIPEDEAISSSLVSHVIEKAQAKIEGLNFDLRKHLLDFDNVLNHQRGVVYERRQGLLFGGEAEVNGFLAKNLGREGLSEEEHSGLENLVARKRQKLGEAFIPALRRLTLQVIDLYWVEQLEAMDYLRSSVNLRAYGQRDPLIEYKREGLRLFKDMEERIGAEVLKLLSGLSLVARAEAEEQKLEEVHQGVRLIGGVQNVNNVGLPAAGAPPSAQASGGKKVGRNVPCPCGAVNPETGRVYKFKHCGLINASYHRS